MTDRHQVRLGAVQETLFIPLAARARESHRKKPVLRDPKAAEMVRSIDYDAAKYGRGAGGSVTVMRTAHDRAARVLESVSVTRPPEALRRQLPPRYRYLLPLVNPILGKTMSITLFEAGHGPANPLAPA